MARPTSLLQDSRTSEVTHEGAPAPQINDVQRLRRSILSCMLFEKSFYEDGMDIADRILDLASKVDPKTVSELAVEARSDFNLRHAPLLLALALTRKGEGKFVEETLAGILQRADEPAEFLALLWVNGKSPVPHAVRRGINRALEQFDEYQLAKWGRKGPITVRDVMRLTHPVPYGELTDLWAKVLADTLATPDTWEVALSGGADKKETFTRLLAENKLGDLAFLRNLRNMKQSGVDKNLVRQSAQNRRFRRVLPFRFLSAAKYVPEWEDILDEALLSQTPDGTLNGHTVVLVDVSGSMHWGNVSLKSEITRQDAAAGIAIMAREMCEDASVYTFDTVTREVRPRRGFALRDEINTSGRGGTNMGTAIQTVKKNHPTSRLIVVTDEQSHQRVTFNGKSQNYVINVAPYKTGVGYGNSVVHIDGFSERVLEYILEVEGLKGV